MNDILDIIELGASEVRQGVSTWQGVTRLSQDDIDVEPLAGGDVFQSLGITSLPYPSDENGKAEALCVRGVGGRNICYVGARDTRSAAIVGNLKAGDIAMHSTGPQQAAQVQCKEDKRQVLMATKDKRGKSMLLMLDGDSGKFQLSLAGMMFEFDSSDKSIAMTNGRASILMQGSTIALDGNVILGGKIGDQVNKLVTSPAVTPGPLPCATGPSVVGLPIAAARGVSLATG